MNSHESIPLLKEAVSEFAKKGNWNHKKHKRHKELMCFLCLLWFLPPAFQFIHTFKGGRE